MTDLLDGFSVLFADPWALAAVLLAAVLGIVFGALPGLTASAAIAMLVPFTFQMKGLGPVASLALLYGIGKSGRYGGSIAAILFNTPGTAASAATMQDGYPMTRQGRAGKALKTATVASVFGDFFGEMLLIFGAVYIAVVTKTFGPTENFAIYVMAFIVIGSVVGQSIVKGLLSTVFGALVALIGEDVITGQLRMTMGLPDLRDGMALVPLLIGVFVISEIIIQAERSAKAKMMDAGMVDMRPGTAASDDPSAQHFTWAEFRRCLPVMVRSSLSGSLIGMMPGLGSSVACFVAYGEEKRRAKDGARWGTGVVEGIAAPESANNAVSGPSMIPLLTLGIPGSTVAAVLIGVFLIHGLQVGPSIFDADNMIIVGTQVLSSRQVIFAMFASGLLCIAAYGLIGYWGGPLIGRTIAAVPTRYLYPFIFLTAIAASYSTRASVWDVGFALLFGVIGYAMRRTQFSAAAFIIAFVLSANMEEAFRQSLLISDNGLLIFVTEPVPAAFLAVGLATVVFRAVTLRRARLKTVPT